MCGGELKEGKTTAPFFIGDKIVVIKEVPAEICSDCDEAFMMSGVVGNVEKLLDKLEELNSEVSVIHYKVA
jgi:YgiT-type zinc finger domain-containing protein